MKRRIAVAVLFSIAVAGCGGPQGVAPSATAPLGASRAPVAPQHTGERIYAYNGGGTPSITDYPVSASGSTAPIRMIAGTSTLLGAGSGIAVSTHGVIAVAAPVSGQASHDLLFFGPRENGDAAPVLAHTASTLNPLAMAYSGSSILWMADAYSDSIVRMHVSGGHTVRTSIFRPKLATPSGNQTAVPWSLATDRAGRLYCACAVEDGTGNLLYSGVTEFNELSPGGRSVVHSFYDPSGGYPVAIAVDYFRRVIYVAFANNSIAAYGLRNPGPSANPVRTITRATSIGGIAVDRAGNLYVGDQTLGEIDVYGPSANGAASPDRSIKDVNLTLTYSGSNLAIR